MSQYKRIVSEHSIGIQLARIDGEIMYVPMINGGPIGYAATHLDVDLMIIKHQRRRMRAHVRNARQHRKPGRPLQPFMFRAAHCRKCGIFGRFPGYYCPRCEPYNYRAIPLYDDA